MELVQNEYNFHGYMNFSSQFRGMIGMLGLPIMLVNQT